MPGQAVKFGPFTGGLNNSSDIANIADDEVWLCENLDMQINGSLKSRPGSTEAFATTGTGYFVPRGWFITSSATYLIMVNTANSRTIWSQPGVSNINTLTTTFAASDVIRYDSKAYLIAPVGEVDPGGYWVHNTFTAQANIPRGSLGLAHKDRLWVAAASRINFSEPGDFNDFPVNNFFDVNPGDGEEITYMYSFDQGIFIWKNDSTYLFSYSADPADGVLQKISGEVGAANRYSVVPYENYFYTYHEGKVYEFLNYTYTQLNIKVTLVDGGTMTGELWANTFVSLFNNRLIVRYFDTVYVYNIFTKTWSTWVEGVDERLSPLFIVPRFDVAGEQPTAYFSENLASDVPKLWKIIDDDSVAANVPCRIATKVSAFDQPFSHKKLLHWGIDVLAHNSITGTVVPTADSELITWDALDLVTWDTLDLSSWDQLLIPSLNIVSTVAITQLGQRVFIRFPAGIRFREVYFLIECTPTAGIFNLFNVYGFINMKSFVPKEVT